MIEPVSAFSGNHRSVLHLWCAYPDDLLDVTAAEACMVLLSAKERARWQRFRFEHSRREYLATHALARTALSHYRPVAAQDWQFTANAYGKPDLSPDCGLRFNLSNSAGLAVCLVADAPAEVGVDVEVHARAEKIAEVARKVFSTEEQAQLDALAGMDRLDRCLSLWTLKEAYIKARGMGMALPLRGISFLFEDSGEVRLELDEELEDNAARWRFRLLNHAGHRIAVMAEEVTEFELEIREFRPEQFAPRRTSTEKFGK
jgi:4'-phosphopantetheinyl transferase